MVHLLLRRHSGRRPQPRQLLLSTPVAGGQPELLVPRVACTCILNVQYWYILPGCRIQIAQGGTPPGGIGAKLRRTTPPGRRGKVVQEDWEVV